ncbi:MAG: hypothetical protein ACYCTB_06885 [bacterium]
MKMKLSTSRRCHSCAGRNPELLIIEISLIVSMEGLRYQLFLNSLNIYDIINIYRCLI